MESNLLVELRDELAKVYNEGIKKGQEHVKPSEDTISMIDDVKKEINDLKISFGKVETNIFTILSGIDEIKNGYVRREEFTPVKSLVYGLVGVILTGCGAAILALILK